MIFNIIRSTIVEYLETKKDGGICLFIFFDYLQKAVQTPYNITLDLLKQLIQQLPDVSESVQSMYTDFKHLNTPPSVSELLKIINSESKRFSKVRLVIDGIHECPAHASDNARATFLDIVRSLAPEISILITARSRDHETLGLGDVIELRYAPTNEDLNRYLHSQIRKHSTDNEILAETGHAGVVAAIISQAEGMLLLARLHVNAVAAQHTSTDLQLALANLPANVDQTYEKAIQRISPGDRPLAERILMWITFAMRPLSTQELQSVLAVNENVSSASMAKGYMLSIRKILNVCEGLVVVDHQVEPNVMRFIHPTVRSYFEAYFDTRKAHRSLVLACNRYLKFEDLKTKVHKRHELIARYESLPFLRYAALNWGHHARQTQDEELCRDLVTFLKNESSLICMAQAMDPLDLDTISAVYIAAHFGLLEVVNQLLAQDAGAVHERMYGETALHNAACKGFVAVVSTLLCHGSNPGLPSEDGRTPVSLAAENGHLAIVRLLISSYGVDPNSKSTTPFHKGQTPLSWAASNGHHTTVEYLLAQDNTNVDIPISDGPFIGRTALMLAAQNGHEKVVGLLLKKGQAVASMVDGDGMNALALAARQGHFDVVKLLLHADAKAADQKDAAYCRRPVDWAMSNCHDEVVRLLLTHPKLDFQDDEERTSLSYEAQYGNLELVQQLLDLEANPNLGDEEGWTPLTYAANFGRTQVADLLLRGGAGPDLYSVDRRSPLSFASEHGHLEIVKLLLTSNAKPDESDKLGRTPLSYASGNGKIEVVEVLLKHKASVNLDPDTTSWTARPPIMLAAANGHDNVVKMLLETEEVTFTWKDTLLGESAIDWATRQGFPSKIIRS